MSDEFHQSVLLERLVDSNEEMAAQVVLLVEEIKLLRQFVQSLAPAGQALQVTKVDV